MKENKSKTFLVITSFLSILILLIGTTFSYFTYDNKSKNNAVAVSAAQIRLNLGVSNLYAGHYIIPLKDELIEKAYEKKCVDDTGRGACLAYQLELFNSSKEIEIEGTIDFNITKIENLSYMVLDEEGNTYQDITHIDSDNSRELTLGPNFIIEDGTLEQTSKKLILLIWLTDNDELQDETDAGGSFTAAVTFRTTEGAKLTATVKGMESSVMETSVIN